MKILTRCLPLLAVAALGACDDSTTAPEGNVPVSLSVALTGSGGPGGALAMDAWAAPPVSRARTFTDGTNELVLEQVTIVLSEVELENLFDDDCEDGDGFDDDCEEFETGPFLLDLPLDGSVETVLEVDVPVGSYDELEFEIDALDDDDQREIDLLRDHPEFDDISVRVTGTWNGEPFVFTSDVEAEQELDLVPPLEVNDGDNPVNLTLRLDLDGWFRDGSGNLVDPATAMDDRENEDLVEDNIEESFELFEDDDRDGEDDYDDDDYDDDDDDSDVFA